MKIDEIITLKYYDLSKLCNKNTIRQIEIQNASLKAIEDIDLLHDLLIRFLKKYKTTEFETLESGYKIIKDEFMVEKNIFSKMQKPETLKFFKLVLKNIENDDLNEI